MALPRMALSAAITTLLTVAAVAQTEAPASAPAAVTGPSAEPAVVDDLWAAVEPEFPERASRPLRRRTGGGAAAVVGERNGETKRPWLRTLGPLAGVVGLIVFLSWGYRSMVGGSLPLMGKSRRPGLIDVISRTSLSARQSLCLVRVGSRLVLIGQSQDTLRALDVIDDADLAARLVGEATRQRSDSSQAEFNDCLEREASGYRDPAAIGHEPVTPEPRRLSDVRQSLADTIRRIRSAVAKT